MTVGPVGSHVDSGGQAAHWNLVKSRCRGGSDSGNASVWQQRLPSSPVAATAGRGCGVVVDDARAWALFTVVLQP